MRREFYDLAKNKTAPIAEEALRRIAALYAIEETVRGKPPEQRRAIRQARSAPLVADLFAWLEQQLGRVPGGSTAAGAIRYALNHRDGLERFLEDGRAEIDSNTIERAIRPLVLGRKNALFASGDEGDSYCPSGHAPTNARLLDAHRRATGVGDAARRRRAAPFRSPGRRTG